jgi:hypothetical protein
MAASKTMWQSEQVSRCRLISFATDGESLPSKYQQIKWIVSRQLMTAVPRRSAAIIRPRTISAFGSPKHDPPAEILIAYISMGSRNSARPRLETSCVAWGKITQRFQHFCEGPPSPPGLTSVPRDQGHLAQSLDAVFQRGVGAEQRRDNAPAKHRLHDAQRRRGR